MDSLWPTIIIGSLSVYSWKILGYVLPSKFAKNEAVVVFAGKLTIALLVALCTVQTIGANQTIQFDSRLPALAVAGLLFWRKAPFLVAVLAAAAVAAGLRFILGWQ